MTLPRILVVEDDQPIRSLLTRALSRRSVTVDTAGDGIEALEKISSFGTYDVVIIDLMMPRMDGFLLLEELRNRSHRPGIVLVMSACDNPALQKLDCSLVHGYIRKPFDLEQIVDLIGDCAEMIRQTGSGSGITPSSDGTVKPIQQRDIDAC